MTDQALDDLARRVILDAARQEYGDWIDQLPEHDFSPAFEKKMQKLIRRADHPIRYQVAKIAACLLLTAFLSGCAVLAISPEAREVFTGWVREVYETSYIYRFFGSDQETSAHIFYRPTYTPSGYQMVKESVSGADVLTILYENDSNKLAVFTCFPSGASPVFQIDRDGTETYKQVSVNGTPAEMYLDQDGENSKILIWMDENTGTIFRIFAPIGETELIKMAESVSTQSSNNEEVIP